MYIDARYAAEKDYLLSDSVAEKKWKFDFAEALERSKQKDCGPQLFKQKLFYLTPKVPIDSRLLKAVVQSAGGQVGIDVAFQDLVRLFLRCRYRLLPLLFAFLRQKTTGLLFLVQKT